MVEDETSHFSEHFAGIGESLHPHGAVHEVVLSLHAEALDQLSHIAREHNIEGSNEYKRSVALQVATDLLRARVEKLGDDIFKDLSLSSGVVKPRPMCVFKDTLDELGRLEKELHCSETILLETAIRIAAQDPAFDAAPVA